MPLIAGFGKLLFAIIVVVPVILMSGHIQDKPGTALDETSPVLIATLYGQRLLGLGIAALIAGLLNSLAANISAFSSLWTGEIYRPSLALIAQSRIIATSVESLVFAVSPSVFSSRFGRGALKIFLRSYC